MEDNRFSEIELVSVMKKHVSKAIASLTIAKSNLNATTAPTITDDTTKGYKEGSTWIYDGVTYTCIDSTASKAVWSDSTAIYYFDSWTALVAAISVTGTTYVGKYASVANANGGPSSELTYTAPGALTNYIVDGGSATFKINAQGTNYSVTCQARTVTNPVVTSVMLVSAVKPTIPGYYIFSVTPTGGLPSGINLNDIAYFNGVAWSVFQTYSAASAVLVAGTTTNTQITWRKFNGTWMSTADDYIPDSKEYQTGKLYNGKAVYRKCTSGSLPSTVSTTLSLGITIPTAGEMILCSGIATRSDNGNLKRFSIGSAGSQVELLESEATGIINVYVTSEATNFLNQPFIAWVEYTKT